MTVMLELSAEEAAALQAIAEAAGVTTEAVLHGLIAQVSGPHKVTKAEKAEDPEEDAERRREQEEVEVNIKRWHAEAKD